ncbi:hypothetical protein MBM_03100 [Drepanopeziza brunnea f. sp. 'multigermtubi' MB_m1]|uniref:Uncharacterized protein n=1 Tax=Marssonina brunnea f. sp. multigermtubi (strain MB_m1) TaxID=1072389 RepID=K1XDC4_MARBU|nr:uncharacterized protein MBM_03100 [Drepanopeziza brunnea f. sp. 'multigermtubi' MB_m1]EKD18858.1 hypothetical protein MBM_03100 [Drepanopeziza brunnea f. sp. 'multigermtubi' MB_m1]
MASSKLRERGMVKYQTDKQRVASEASERSNRGLLQPLRKDSGWYPECSPYRALSAFRELYLRVDRASGAAIHGARCRSEEPDDVIDLISDIEDDEKDVFDIENEEEDGSDAESEEEVVKHYADGDIDESDGEEDCGDSGFAGTFMHLLVRKCPGYHPYALSWAAEPESPNPMRALLVIKARNDTPCLVCIQKITATFCNGRSYLRYHEKKLFIEFKKE